jgi:pentatricopeptide repeat protein
LQAQGIRTDQHTFSIAIASCAQDGRVEEAEQLLQRVRGAVHQPDTITYNTIMDVYAKCGDTAKALRTLDIMLREGVPPDVYTYSSAIASCVKHGRAEEAEQVEQRMREAGLQPDVFTYSTLMDVYAKCGDVAKALRTLDVMQREGVAPNVVTFNTAIASCVKDGRAEEAEQLEPRMREAGLRPDVTTYNTLMDVYAKCGDARKALQLLQRMRAEGMECDVTTFGAAMDACSKGGAWESALQLLTDMCDAGIVPNVKVWNALLDALGRAGRSDLMLQQFAAMKAEECTPNKSTYRTLTSALAAASEHAQVDELYREALASGAVDPHDFHRMSAVERRRRNLHPQGMILDLHELNVPLALAAVQLELAEGKRARLLSIVTGKGTTTGIIPIRDAVTGMLTERGIAYTVPAHNAGVVIVPWCSATVSSPKVFLVSMSFMLVGHCATMVARLATPHHWRHCCP